MSDDSMHPSLRNEKGVALSLLLVAVVLLAALAVVIAASSRTHMQSGQQKARLLAGMILDQANLMSNGFYVVQANGFGIDQVTFDALNPQGLFNPQNRAAVKQVPPAEALAGGIVPIYDLWMYRQNSMLEGAGDDAVADYFLQLHELTLPVCQQINQALYNDPAVPHTQAASATIVDWYTLAHVMDFTADPAHATLNRPEGCLATFDYHYVYYKMILAR